MNPVHLLGAAAAVALPLAAQCPPHGAARSLETLFAGTTLYANATPPQFGVSLDPGTAIRFDLHVECSVVIHSIGVNLLNDGGAYASITVPNLIGAPNGTMELWGVVGDSVTNPALFTANTYLHLPPPGVGPLAPWARLSSPTDIGNLVFAAPDMPSIGTFSTGVALGPGDYALCCVLVPQGVAGPAGVPANPATDRIHPLFTNLNVVPGPVVYEDDFLRITNPGVQSPAFANSALSPISGTPFMPNFRIGYSISNDCAYKANYGSGCRDRACTFYESFAAPGTVQHLDIEPVGSAGARNGLDFFYLGPNYLVTENTTPGLFVPPGSTAGALHVNALAPGLGAAWDDATSGPIALPFTFPYACGGLTTVADMSSNGVVYLQTATSSFGFYDDYAGFVGGQPAIAAAFGDLEPADLVTPGGGTGDMWVDSDGATWVAFTWDGVQEWNQPANRTTAQVVLHAAGNVSIRYGAAGVGFANAPVLVGFTPGNGAADPGSGATPRQAPDLSVAAAGSGYVSGDGMAAPRIHAIQRPRITTPLILETHDVPGPPTALVLTYVSAAPWPGVIISPPFCSDCQVWINPGPTVWLPASWTGTHWVANFGPIPPPPHFEYFAQSVVFTTMAPCDNLLLSDAVCLHTDWN